MIKIGNKISYAFYSGTGFNNSFTFSFAIRKNQDLVVEVDGVEQSQGVAYSLRYPLITGKHEGRIDFEKGYTPAKDSTIFIYRSLVIGRISDYLPRGDFTAAEINDDLDHITRILQDLALDINRSLKFPLGESINLAMPGEKSRANKIIFFNKDGDLTLIPLPKGGSGGSGSKLPLDVLALLNNLPSDKTPGHLLRWSSIVNELETIDPAIFDKLPPLAQGNLVIWDAAGLKNIKPEDLSKLLGLPDSVDGKVLFGESGKWVPKDIQKILQGSKFLPTAEDGKLLGWKGTQLVNIAPSSSSGGGASPTVKVPVSYEFSTGVIEGLNLSVASNTEIGISAGTARIVDCSNPAQPVGKDVTFTANTAVTVPDIKTNKITYIFLEDDSTNSGKVVFQTAVPTASELQRELYLGYVLSRDLQAVRQVYSDPILLPSLATQLQELWNASKKTDVRISPIVGGLKFKLEGGTLWMYGTNTNNSLPYSVRKITASNPLSFDIRSSKTSYVNDIAIRKEYETGGAFAPLPANKWGIFSAFLYRDGKVHFQAPTVLFDDKDNPTRNLLKLSKQETIDIDLQSNAVPLGLLLIRKDVTDLADNTKAKWIPQVSLQNAEGAGVGTLPDRDYLYKIMDLPKPEESPQGEILSADRINSQWVTKPDATGSSGGGKDSRIPDGSIDKDKILVSTGGGNDKYELKDPKDLIKGGGSLPIGDLSSVRNGDILIYNVVSKAFELGSLKGVKVLTRLEEYMEYKKQELNEFTDERTYINTFPDRKSVTKSTDTAAWDCYLNAITNADPEVEEEFGGVSVMHYIVTRENIQDRQGKTPAQAGNQGYTRIDNSITNMQTYKNIGSVFGFSDTWYAYKINETTASSSLIHNHPLHTSYGICDYQYNNINVSNSYTKTSKTSSIMHRIIERDNHIMRPALQNNNFIYGPYQLLNTVYRESSGNRIYFTMTTNTNPSNCVFLANPDVEIKNLTLTYIYMSNSTSGTSSFKLRFKNNGEDAYTSTAPKLEVPIKTKTDRTSSPDYVYTRSSVKIDLSSNNIKGNDTAVIDGASEYQSSNSTWRIGHTLMPTFININTTRSKGLKVAFYFDHTFPYHAPVRLKQNSYLNYIYGGYDRQDLYNITWSIIHSDTWIEGQTIYHRNGNANVQSRSRKIKGTVVGANDLAYVPYLEFKKDYSRDTQGNDISAHKQFELEHYLTDKNPVVESDKNNMADLTKRYDMSRSNSSTSYNGIKFLDKVTVLTKIGFGNKTKSDTLTHKLDDSLYEFPDDKNDADLPVLTLSDNSQFLPKLDRGDKFVESYHNTRSLVFRPKIKPTSLALEFNPIDITGQRFKEFNLSIYILSKEEIKDNEFIHEVKTIAKNNAEVKETITSSISKLSEINYLIEIKGNITATDAKTLIYKFTQKSPANASDPVKVINITMKRIDFI